MQPCAKALACRKKGAYVVALEDKKVVKLRLYCAISGCYTTIVQSVRKMVLTNANLSFCRLCHTLPPGDVAATIIL